MLVSSRGKLESILRIASCEHTAMGEKLRMLILTDYIRSEYRSAIGDADKTPGIMGVLPVFELLRRRGAGWRLGVSVRKHVVIRMRQESFCGGTGQSSARGRNRSLRNCVIPEGTSLGYSEVKLNGGTGICTVLLQNYLNRDLSRSLWEQSLCWERDGIPR